MKKVRCVLTFDDGPSRYTNKVLNVLRNNSVQNNIKAAFFVLTKNSMMKSEAGKDCIKDIYYQGHLIGLHGTLHLRFVDRVDQEPYCNYGRCDHDNALDCDMYLGCGQLYELVEIPKFVRPPYWQGFGITAVRSIWKKHNLKGIYRNVHTKDTGFSFNNRLINWFWNFLAQLKSDPKDIINNIKKDMTKVIQSGENELIFSFHDTNKITVDNLELYLKTIKETCDELNVICEFTSNIQQIESIFNNRND